MKDLYIGTSGYNYKGWKDLFYKGIPQKRWLEFYSSNFNTVEINSTFYGSIKRKTFENWKNITPADFIFTLKGSRFITHVKRLNNVKDSIGRFFNEAQGLGEKFKVTLWQFPGNFVNKEENFLKLQKFISFLPKNKKQTFEFRHNSWFKQEIFDLLNKEKMGFVINDSPNFPSTEKITGSFAYIRFHGPSSLYSSKYSDSQLNEWSKKIREYLEKYEVYCYFNNDINAYAVQNASKLKLFLQSFLL